MDNKLYMEMFYGYLTNNKIITANKVNIVHDNINIFHHLSIFEL